MCLWIHVSVWDLEFLLDLHYWEVFLKEENLKFNIFLRRLLQAHTRQRHNESAKRHKCEICTDKSGFLLLIYIFARTSPNLF